MSDDEIGEQMLVNEDNSEDEANDNYEECTVVQLKAELKKRDLGLKGKKAELIERLMLMGMNGGLLKNL